MKACIYLFFLICFCFGNLHAQEQSLTYTMKLTRVYSDFPINQDPGGPDLRYRIRGLLVGLGGATEIREGVDVYLENNQQIGWIDIPDEVIATGSIAPNGPAINLCSSGIGIDLEELRAWESDNGNGADVANGDDSPALLSGAGILGAPETTPGSGIPRTFQVLTSNTIPGSHFGYEFEVTYTLENGIKEIIIAGNAQGDPVASACEGGTVFLSANVGPRFTGGNYIYEMQVDGTGPWSFVGQGNAGAPAVSVPLSSTNRYRARLQFCLQGDISGEPNKYADLSSLPISPGINSTDIVTSFTSLCEGSDNGTVTVEDILGLPDEARVQLQLNKQVFTAGAPANPTVTTTVGALRQDPHTFTGVTGGNYVIIASRLIFNTMGQEVPSCTVNSPNINLSPAAAPVSFSTAPASPRCEETTGRIDVTYGGSGAVTFALYTTANDLVAGPVAANAAPNHVFTGVAPGNYYVQVANAAGCTRDSDPFIITPPVAPAGGSFAPVGGSFNLDCPAEMATFNFTPASGTGENMISLTRLASGQRIPVFSNEIVNAGSPYQAVIRGGDYELTFERTDNGCINTQTFTVTSNQTPVNIVLLSSTQPTACMPTSGVLSLEVSGGTQPYTIEVVGQSISPATTTPVGGNVQYTYNNVPGGDNLIRITDANGCIEELPLAVPAAAGVSLTINDGASNLDLTCNGDTDGSVQFVGQGVGALQYKIVEINNNFSTQSLYQNLPGGQYTGVMRDATGCEASISFEVFEPIEIEVLSVDVVPRDYCPDPIYDVTIRVKVPVGRFDCVNGVPGNTDANRLWFSRTDGTTWDDVFDNVGVQTTGSLCDGIVDVTFLNESVGNNSYIFGFLDQTISNTPLLCPSDQVQLTAADFVERPAPFVEIIGQTNPSCYDAYDGSLTVRYGGGDPNGSYRLKLYGGFYGAPPNAPVNVNGFASPEFFLPYTTESTFTVTGLPDLDIFFRDNFDAYYFFEIRQLTPQGGFCDFYSVSESTPSADRVRLDDGEQLTFTRNVVKGFECDGTGAILSIGATGGGTPPYQFKISGFNQGEPEETLRDFSSATTFNLNYKDSFRITMRDANGCVFDDNGTTFGIAYVPTIDYGISFTPDPINGCPPDPSDFLGGELRVNGGLGETTYSFSTVLPGGGTVGRPLPITTSDSIIELSGMLAGEVTVLLTNTATGQSCAQATFTYEAPPLPLTATTTLNQGESCLGSADGVISILAEGGQAPITFIDRGMLTVFQPGETPELTINGVTSGIRTVLIQDANGCSLIHRVDVAPSPGNIFIDITTDNSLNCVDSDNGNLTITPQGGTGPYLLTWEDPDGFPVTIPAGASTTRMNLSRQEYPLTIVDINGCSNSFSPMPGGRDQLIAEIVDIVQPGCNPTGSFRVSIFQNSFPASSSFTASINGGTPQSNLTFSALGVGTYSVLVFDDAGCAQANDLTITLSNTNGLSISATPTDASCFGQADGSIQAVAANGSPPYQYSLDGMPAVTNGTFNNLPAGSYSIEVTDASGCTANAGPITVSEPDAVQGSALSTNASCPGESSGSITLQGTSGLAPFEYRTAGGTYSTFPTFSNLAAGTYQFQIKDANDCESGLFSVTVDSSTPFSLAQTTNQPADCNTANGSATIEVIGGNTGYSFSWPDGQSGPTAVDLPSGTYEVTVSSANGCIQTVIATVGENPAPMINIIREDDETCEDGNGRITLQGTGGTSPYTYTWSDEPARTVSFVDTLSAGTYTITLTDAAGCSDEVTIVLGTTQGITVSLESSTISVCGEANGSATVTAIGGIEPLIYSWSHDPAADGPTVNNLPAGISTVTVTSANGCSDQLTISTSSQPGIALINGFATDTRCGLDNGMISATAVSGTAPFTYAWSHTDTLAGSPAINLAPGEYSVTITDANNCSLDRTFTVLPSTNNLSVNIIDQRPSDCATPNGTMQIEPLGNIGGVNYSWSHDPGLFGNFAFGLAAGDYSVTITEPATSCSAILDYTIVGLPGGGTVLATNSTNTSCGLNNGILEVEPNVGNGPFTYEWSHTDTLTTGTATNLAPGSYAVTATDADGCLSEGTFTIGGSTTPDIFLLNIPTADCGQTNGTLNIVPAFLPNPTYNWSHDPNLNAPLAENLAGGDYSVTVTSTNGCSAEKTFTVENVGFLSVTANVTNSLCVDGNGSVSVTVASGIPPYTYDWAHAPGVSFSGFSGLNSGSYPVTVTDATGCTGQAFPFIGLDEPPTLTVFTQVDTRCGEDNGFLYVNASGGESPYVFDWAEIPDQTPGQTSGFDGFSGPAGDYNLTVTDANGCTVTGTYTINDSEPLEITVTNQVDPTGGLDNGSITLSVSGATAPVMYTWNHDANLNGPLAENLPAGSYTVSVEDDNFCFDEVTVVLSSGLVAEIINLNNALCTNDNGTAEVNVLTGTPPYSYAWSHAPGTDVAAFSNLSEGSYSVTVSDATGATFELNFSIEFEQGIDELFSFASNGSCGISNGQISVFPGGGNAPYTYNWADFPSVNEGFLTDLAVGEYALTVTDAQGCSISDVITVMAAPDPEISIDEIEQPSNGMDNGFIGVLTSGFSNPITYTWSHDPSLNLPFADDLPLGVYTLTVTGDNGCTEEITINLNGDPIIIAEIIDLQDAGCSNDDGQATVDVTIGAFPFTYVWSHAPGENVESFNNLAGGDYMVTVSDDAGAMTVLSFTIGALSGPTAINATANDGTTCGENNAVLTVAPVDGSAPFEYEWEDFPAVSGPTLTDLPPGDYTVTITDANTCQATETFTVNGSDIPTVSVATQNDPTCGNDNGSIALTSIGLAEPITAVWSHDANLTDLTALNLAAGTYNVTLIGSLGCTASLSITLNPGVVLATSLSNVFDATCTDGTGTASVVVSTGTAPFTYTWSHAPGVSQESFDNLFAGDYSVTIEDANLCTSVETFSIDLITGPTAITATVLTGTTCGQDNGTLEVVPTGGSGPFNYDWADFPNESGPVLTDLAPGSYLLTVTDDIGCSISETFSINGSAPPLVSLEVQTNPDPGMDNGSISITTSGMAAPLTYVWSHDTALNGPLAEDLANGSYTVTVTGANGCSDDLTVVLDGPDPVVAEITGLTDATCTNDNGMATVIVTQGVAPFSYAWSHAPGVNEASFSDLAAGDYSVVVTDAAGVTEELTFRIQFIEGPSDIIATDNAGTSCGEPNAILTVSPVGGSGPFSYTWAGFPSVDGPTLSSLSPGTYEVTVTDDNSCTNNASFLVEGSDLPSINLVELINPDPDMDNGTITVSTSGMTSPLTYNWSHDPTLNDATATDLANGPYTVIVTGANGCSDDLTVVLNGPNPIVAEIVDRADAFCTDDSGTAAVSVIQGVAPYTYAWSHAPGVNIAGFTDLAAGAYTVTVTDAAGVMQELSFSIAFVPGPTDITITTQLATTCGLNNGAIGVTPQGGNAPYTFTWSHDASLATGLATDLAPGTYTIIITDANDCPISETITIDGSDVPLVSLDTRINPDPGLDNGSISITTSGLIAPLTYEWSHDATLNAQMADNLANGSYTITVTDVNGCTDDLTVVLNGPDPIIAEVTGQTDATCTDDNGRATINVTQGVPPFSYAWSHAPGVDVASFTDLAAGDYSVVVTDAAGVTEELTFRIQFIEGPTAILVSTRLNTTCGLDNGVLEINPQGGNAPYSFAWSHDASLNTGVASGLASGMYTVTITDVFNCAISETFTIDGSDVPLVSLDTRVNPDPGLDNGSIRITTSGLTAPRTYEWSHDATLNAPLAEGLSNGTYIVTVTGSNGCTDDLMIILDGPDPIIAEITGLTNATCTDDNGMATVSVTQGIAPFSYAWSHAPGVNLASFTDLAAGDYTVVVTDAAGVTEELAFSITFVPGLTSIEVTTQIATTCGLDNGILEVIPQGGTAPYSYVWSHDNGVTSSAATDLAPGTYTVSATDANGCTSSETFTIGQSLLPSVEVVDAAVATCDQADGLLEISTNNLTPPLTYEWSHDAELNAPLAENLVAGEYGVTVTGADGCQAVIQATVSGSDGPVLSLLSVTNSTCSAADGSVTVSTDGNGQSTFTYAWSHNATLDSPAANNLTAGTYQVTVTDATGCSDALSATVLADATALLPTLSLAPASCDQNDGTAMVILAGGTAPFSYTWSHDANLSGPVATNLPTGEHNLIITDANGCSETEAFTILTTTGPEEVLTIEQINTSCGENNGRLEVGVVGGTAPLSFAWSHDDTISAATATDLAGGEYTVTITDANGCTIIRTLFIAGSETPVASVLSQSDANCGQSNGTVTISATGLATPLTYAWGHDPGLNAPTAFGLPAGSYEVTVTGDNGCVATVGLVISDIGGPLLMLDASVNSKCGEADGSILLNNTDGTGPYNFAWSHDSNLDGPLATDLSAGFYTVTVTDANGCTDDLTIELENEAGPESITAVDLTPTTCGLANGALTIAVTGGTPPYSYNWSHDAMLRDNQADNLDGAVYQVIVTDANGCSISNTFSVPTSPTLTIVQEEVVGANCNLADGSIALSILNATGTVTYNWNHAPGLDTAQLTGLVAGTYQVTVTDEGGCSAEELVVVNSLDNPATFTITPSPSNCGDGQGSIAVTIADGRPPYTYAWSHDNVLNEPVADGLTAGDYNVLVTDAIGCQVLLEASIDLVPEPTATVTTTEPTCSGEANGGLVVEVEGGTAPYTYLWNTGATSTTIIGATAGDYSVIVTDASGCTTSVEVNLADGPDLLISVLDSIPATCAEVADGQLEVAVTGGTGPYTFAWSEGTTDALITGLSAGTTYEVTVSSSEGCTATMSYTMPEAEPIMLPFPADTTFCQDDIWTLDLTGYGNTLVTGPNGFTSTEQVVLIEAAGIYNIAVSEASGCSGSAEVVVNFTGETFVAGMVLPSDVVVGDSVVVLETSWPAPDEVNWIFDQTGVRQVDQQQNQYWFIFDESGDYQLSLLASFGGCDDLLTKQIIVHPDSTTIPATSLMRTGIEDVILSPNPNEGNFTANVVLTNPDPVFMNLYQLDGTPIERRESAGNTNYTFNYNLNLNPGSYLLLVQTPSARRMVVVIVI